MSRQSDLDNHANQLNPNNDAYWESRRRDERPDDWEEVVSRAQLHPERGRSERDEADGKT